LSCKELIGINNYRYAWGIRLSSKVRIIRARYEGGVLRPLEPLELEEGEEVLVMVEKLDVRKRIVEEFYGKRGPAPKELLDEFMLEAEAQ